MTNSFLYERVADSSLYEIGNKSSIGWAGYILPDQGSLPPTISLYDSLHQQKLKGHYLFAVARPPILNSDPTKFAQSALEYIKKLRLTAGNRVMMWLEKIHSDDSQWFGDLRDFGFKFNRNITDEFQLNSNLNVQLGLDQNKRNMTFYVLESLILSVDGDAGQFLLSKQSNRPSKSKLPSIGFQKKGKAIGISVESERAWIPVSGNNAACFVFAAQIQPSVAFNSSDNGLDLGFKYGVKTSQKGGDGASLIYYPSFNVAALPGTLNCVGTVDPSDPVNTRLGSKNLKAGYLRTGFGIAEPPPPPPPPPQLGFFASPRLAPWLQRIVNYLCKLPCLRWIASGSQVAEIEANSHKIALNSYFRTPEGNTVSLVPLGTEAKDTSLSLMAGALALASASPAKTEIGQGIAYLTLAGKFGLTVEGMDAGKAQALLGGLFGSERLSFTTYDDKKKDGDNDTIFFLPSQPAYAPVFPFTTASLESPDSGAVKSRLDGTYLTSWATLFAAPGNAVDYRAEPEGSPLYAPPSSLPSGGETLILNSAPPKMALPQSPEHAFPLLPYGGVSAISGTDGKTLTQFESQIIEATRKTVISTGAKSVWEQRAKAQLNASSSTYSTTPQGLVVQIEPNSGAYIEVQMAQSKDREENQVLFAFDKPSQPVQNALQTNQLFLVAVNNKFFDVSHSGSQFKNVVYISDWKMAAQIGKGVTATSYRNVVIFKFCEGTLKERITNPNRWTDPKDFSLLAGASTKEGASPEAESLAYTGLSQWLQDYIEKALDRAAKGDSKEFYQNFKSIVTDPLWKGVLVLDADLSAEALPPQIQGLAAGIDFSKFVAHHFGFTVSRVSVKSGGVIEMQDKSSLFGLIDYENSAYEANLRAGVDANTPIPVQTSDDFDFTVLQLQSLFENANLVDFKSRIQLTVDRLFGSRVIQAYNNGALVPTNGVVLVGSYVKQGSAAKPNADGSGDGGTYVFQQTRSTVFILDSNVLSAVAFNRVQFNTLGPRDGGTTIASRFLVWGAFDFIELQDSKQQLLDVLSFGSPPNTATQNLGKGLAFSNLLINMSFPKATPNAKRFALDTSKLAYDLNGSSPRDTSLFKGFGLQLQKFINASAKQTPADYGFLPVTSSLQLQPLDESWFGVVYNVTLGGPGALVSAAGFSSSLLVAWSPATKKKEKEKEKDQNRAVFLGLSLPGAAPGAQLFSLEGVFKVAVGSIAILRQKVPGATDSSEFYCLRLDDIGIKILGIAKLPPDATIRFFLFGDPNNTGSLGWYAAYIADPESTSVSTPTKQTLALAPVDTTPLLAPDSVPELAQQSPQ